MRDEGSGALVDRQSQRIQLGEDGFDLDRACLSAIGEAGASGLADAAFFASGGGSAVFHALRGGARLSATVARAGASGSATALRLRTSIGLRHAASDFRLAGTFGVSALGSGTFQTQTARELRQGAGEPWWETGIKVVPVAGTLWLAGEAFTECTS